ncbi:MAG: hypothetical protein ACOCSR_04185, partial [Wenzhouxiangella sp.]
VFCSSWAPRVPILIAIAIPAGISLLQHTWSLVTTFELPQFNLGLIMLKRLGSGVLPTNINWQIENGGANMQLTDVEFSDELFMSFSNIFDYLIRVEMWIGFVIALALLAGAVWFRRRAADS